MSEREAAPRDRFFVEGTLAIGSSRALPASDARKVNVVLRKRSGEQIALIDSGGRVFRGVLTVDGAAVAVRAIELLAEPKPMPIELVVAQALPKGRKMDYVVEKATELGVCAVIPVQSERVIGDRRENARIDRWSRVARTAAQQCGGDRVPEIEPVHTWAALLARFAEFDRVLLPWELADQAPLRDHLPALLAKTRRILAVIGPEGGISHDEANSAIAAGATAISLGARILRTETAALALTAAIWYELRAI